MPAAVAHRGGSVHIVGPARRLAHGWITAVAVIAASLGGPVHAQLLADDTSAVGDSITRAFDAEAAACTYGDQPARSFATGDNHGSAFCEAGSVGTFSHAERLECAKGADVEIFNDAESGARIDDFSDQASVIRGRFSAAPGPHYVTVLLGHNDACTNVTTRTGNTCGGDRDPNNYCRTTAGAFERELRRGLDELMQIPGVRIAVLALIRISQLCNFRDKDVCGPLFGVLECELVWGSGDILEDVFGTGGICASLTSDCSDQRRIDMYETLVAYNGVLERVTGEYAALPEGGASATGAVKAANVALRYIDATFHYRFQSDDISCCDCFHPSDRGQGKLAQFTWDGLACSEDAPCCPSSENPLDSARCVGMDTTSVYPGGFWANGLVCGNGVVDPGEACDDGNSIGGDGCSVTCAADGGATPTATPIGAPSPTPTGVAPCAGDCGDDGLVSVDELIVAVNIALGMQPPAQCPAADVDASGGVTIDELVTAVNHALSGCA